ncbi:MAG: response regulator [Desulfobacteraceae bacterium]|nr:response regulator [Desulfobacteraceae bacterium]MBT4364888.1 response regulator [Desulfobacteraceae bacterium]
MENDILSIPQAAKHCAVSRVTLWKFVKSGEIKASRTPGGHYRINKDDLQSFISNKNLYSISNNQSGDKKILIVDDDTHTLKMLTILLSKHKYITEVASDGFSAGIKIKEFKPDLVILDLFMPGINGFEVCMQIKKNSRTSHIKVLAVTGYDNKETKDKIIGYGADDYLAKPIVKNTLLRHIEDLLKDKEYMSELNY